MPRKRGPGRPRRARQASEVRFEIRLTGPERTRWQEAADRQGIDLATLVRESVETCIARGSTR